MPATHKGKEKGNKEGELDEVNADATARTSVVGDISKGGEAIDHLPGQIRGPDEKGDRGGDPRVSRPQLVPERRGEEDGDGDAGNEANDRVFHLEADPQRDAQIDPVPGPAVDDDAEEPVQGDHPRGYIKNHGLEDVARTDDIRRRDPGDDSNSLKPQRTTQPADIGAAECNEEATDE